MLVKTSDLTNGEKLQIERRRNTRETQAKAAKRYGVDVATYRAWEQDAEKGPRVKLGKLSDGEQCWLMRQRMGWTIDELVPKAGLCRWWITLIETNRRGASTLLTFWEEEIV